MRNQRKKNENFVYKRSHFPYEFWWDGIFMSKKMWKILMENFALFSMNFSFCFRSLESFPTRARNFSSFEWYPWTFLYSVIRLSLLKLNEKWKTDNFLLSKGKSSQILSCFDSSTSGSIYKWSKKIKIWHLNALTFFFSCGDGCKRVSQWRKREEPKEI